LVLFVLGGLSAQGEWSVWGQAEIGVVLNFMYEDASNNAFTASAASAYNYYGWYGDIAFEGGLDYRRDGFTFGVYVNQATWANMEFSVSYDGGNFGFAAASEVIDLLGGWGASGTVTGGTGAINNPFKITSGGVNELWGWYEFFDGIVYLEVAYVSQSTDFWMSATTVGDVFDDAGNLISFNDGFDVAGWGFTDVDGNNYLAADFRFDGLSFGVILPFLFWDNRASANYNTDAWLDRPTTIDISSTNAGFPAASQWSGALNFIEDVLQNMIIGAKFDMDPIVFAIQFNMANYGAYLGATWSLGAVTAELSFEGIFDDDETTQAGIAAGLNWNAGQFGAGIKVGYLFIDDDAIENIIGVAPNFFFNVIPEHMAFSLDAGFWFNDDDFMWSFTPQIFWNFKGTGAGADYWWPNNTAIILRYKLAKDMFNTFDVTFKWNM
jgi:hypothetical protein